MMGYDQTSPQQANVLRSAQPAQPDSLLNDSTRLGDQLADLVQRAAKITDALHGVSPREIADYGKPKEGQQVSLRRNIDAALNLATELSNEISRIETRL